MTARETFLVFCMRFIGLPYIWGGSNPNFGLDCSGLVQILLDYFHLDPKGDQSADDLMKYLNKNGVCRKIQSEINLADIIFYGTAERATHVALALGNGLMLEAGGGDHTCTSPDIARAKKAQVRVSNINRRTDIVCVIRPNGLPW